MTVPGGSTLYDAKTAGHRALRNVALSYLVALGQDQYYAMAQRLFNEAKNMTDVMGALGAMNGVEHSIRDNMMVQFYEKWKNEHTTILNYHRLVVRLRQETAVLPLLLMLFDCKSCCCYFCWIPEFVAVIVAFIR